jgi:phage tail sheath protein FI
MAVVQYKTPGVYVEELDAFPPSIVGVETAVPVFIGYTDTAEKNGRSVYLQPIRIASMADYAAVFGGAFEPKFKLTDPPAEKALADAKDAEQKTAKDLQDAKDALAKAADAEKAAKQDDVTAKEGIHNQAQGKVRTAEAAVKSERLGPADVALGNRRFTLDYGTIRHYLYNALRLFYANGGGSCYIVSVGGYGDAISYQPFKDGLDAVQDLVGPTMLVIPEAVLLTSPDYNKLVTDMLTQCLSKQDRVAILDIWAPPDFSTKNLDKVVQDFRQGLAAVPSAALKYGMAYAPFLRTSIVDPSELDYTNFSELEDGKPGPIAWALLDEANRLYPDEPKPALADKSAETKQQGAETKSAETKGAETKPEGAETKSAETKQSTAPGTQVTEAAPAWLAAMPKDMKLTTKASQIGTSYLSAMAKVEQENKDKKLTRDEYWAQVKKINEGLTAQVPALKEIYKAMAAKLGLLPPSAAMAGVFTQNDTLRGVWNAPANVGLNAVIAPMLSFSNKMQENLNMPIDGLAINAIREFVGRGTLVWGARTLDGNSNDWRYIQVRRALIYIEQSVELALNKFVFEPNVGRTWVTVASMVGGFLRGVWQAGGLMGATPNEAFSVQCGLGSTMTAQDVLEGRMIVQIKLQMVRPAEFIVLTFQQQMQGGAA